MSTIARCPIVSRKLALLAGLGFLWIQTGPTLAQDLIKSSNCVVRGNGVTDASPGGAKPTTRIRMKNDGGWCWAMFWAQLSPSKWLQADEYIITSPAAHGNVVLTDAGNKHVRIAYQPEPGFVGTDHFVIHLKYLEVDSTYSVAVRP